MPLIKHNIQTGEHHRITDDPWTFLADDAAIQGQNVVVPFARAADAITAGVSPLGVSLNSDHMPEDVAPLLEQISLVVLNFHSFADGRGFSTARILRETYGFKGEIRAVGHVLRDQFMYLVRCGVDCVETRTEKDAETWVETLTRFAVAYQPGLDNRPWAEGLRLSNAAT